MLIRNIHNLAEHFGTTADGLETALFRRAKTKLYVCNAPTNVRIGKPVDGCNTDFCIVCSYPFESSAVDIFVDCIDHMATEAYTDAFDDPSEMLMNLTNPGENLTVDDVKNIVSEAEAQGWHFDPTITAEDFLAIYKDMDAE